MPEQLQKLLNRILEWWKKFNTKQRALLISLTAVVLVALVILAYAVSRPTYVSLVVADSAKEGSEIKDLLDSDGEIDYTVSTDGTVFKVNEKDEADAVMLLGANDIQAESYSITNVTSGGMSTTESDKQKLYQDYLEKKFADHLSQLENVESATVDITLPNNDGTILSKDEEGTAAVCLTLDGTMDSDQAYGLATYIATELGNESTTGITIIDTDGNVLFSGADADSSIGVVSSQLSYQQKQENLIKNEIVDALVGTNLFSNVSVAMNLSVNYDTTEVATHEYSVPEGMSQGYYSTSSEYSSETTGGTAATPGTDSNDDTTYVTEDGTGTSSKITENQYEYVHNETITNKKNSGGSINYDDSSVSIVCTSYLVYDEELLEESGDLEDTTWEAYKAAHSDPVQVDVDEQFYSVVANATGFSTEDITIVCYQQPEFVDKASSGRSLSDILQIVLAVLIFAMLGYVVFRSTRKAKETEMEPELSVEGLLESTQAEEEEELDDIGYTEKSETRILIEKFVDENPEAAANLLRNWLNAGWD